MISSQYFTYPFITITLEALNHKLTSPHPDYLPDNSSVLNLKDKNAYFLSSDSAISCITIDTFRKKFKKRIDFFRKSVEWESLSIKENVIEFNLLNYNRIHLFCQRYS